MSKKPTYEELEGRVKELERNSFQHRHTKEALKRIKDEQTVLLGAVPAMIFWIDKEGDFMRVNERFAAALKKSPDEINGKSLFDLYPEDQSRKYHNDNLEVIESGNSKKNIEECVQTPAGTMWVCTDRIPYRDKEGNVVGIVGFSVDITDRKRAEEDLRKSEEKLDAMLRSIGDHMSMMDKDLNIIWANEIAKKVFGDDIIGKKCFEAYHRRKEPCEPYPCLTLKALQDEKVHKHETQVIDKDGKIIHFHCTANVALRDREGKPTAVIEISRDISARKEAEEALRQREAALEIRTNELEETNRALRLLLKRMDEGRGQIEETVSLNIKELVLPYAEKLKINHLTAKQMTYLSILESNLNNIASPFVRKMSSKHFGFTPAEIQVASLVRDGKTTKEIAELLNSSERTIESHRINIRMKIGIKKKKTNLRSLLLSLGDY